MDKKFENLSVSPEAAQNLIQKVYKEQEETDRQPGSVLESEPVNETRPYQRYNKMSIYNKAEKLFKPNSGLFVDALKKAIGYKSYGEFGGYDYKELQHFKIQESDQDEAKKAIDDAKNFIELLRSHGILEKAMSGISNKDLDKLPEFEAYLDQLEKEL